MNPETSSSNPAESTRTLTNEELRSPISASRQQELYERLQPQLGRHIVIMADLDPDTVRSDLSYAVHVVPPSKPYDQTIAVEVSSISGGATRKKLYTIPPLEKDALRVIGSVSANVEWGDYDHYRGNDVMLGQHYAELSLCAQALENQRADEQINQHEVEYATT